MATKQPRPYHSYPFILKTRAMIAEFLGCGVNQLDQYIAAGAPIIKIIPQDNVNASYRADKLALRQWLGVRVPFCKGGACPCSITKSGIVTDTENTTSRKSLRTL
jgi:hypothetical protein